MKLPQIFQAEYPEKVVAHLPAQTLYLAIRSAGLSDSLEVIELCNKEQTALLLDLDLWEEDRFSEERFWEWLELPEVNEDVEILTKILKSCDLKLVSLLIARYVSVHINTEPTDEPPSAHYHTPDKGYTWIYVTIAEPHRNFLMNRFMACIFDYSPEIFYQLINVPNVATPSALEEESYQEKQKRLMAEGFPDHDLAWEINSPKELQVEKRPQAYILSKDVTAVPMEVFHNETLYPFTALWENSEDTGELDAELTLIINSAIIRYKVSIADQDALEFLINQVKGAINIALEKHPEVYPNCTLQDLYRAGLAELTVLRQLGQKYSPEELKEIYQKDQMLFNVIAGARDEFPRIAEEVDSGDAEELAVVFKPFLYLAQVTEFSEKLFSE